MQRLKLRESNEMVAARLVRHAYASYARGLPSERQSLERGGEGPGSGLGPNNNINNTNKNSWAAFGRPIFWSICARNLQECQ